MADTKFIWTDGTSDEISVTAINRDFSVKYGRQKNDLKEVIIGNRVKSIEEDAFRMCKNLEKVEMSDSVQSIMPFAFAWCDSLEEMRFPEGIDTVGISVMSFCPSLKKVSIPDSVTMIDEEAFSYCTGLTNVKMPESLESIYVKGNSGMVSVANFASVKKGLGPVTINRTNQTRVVTVTADNNGMRNDYEVENDIKDGIAETFIIPDGVTIVYEGNWKDTQEQGRIFGLIGAMAIILVFGVMAGTYESFRAPFINLCTIPFLTIGVVFIYKISGQAFSMMSAVLPARSSPMRRMSASMPSMSVL